MRCLRMSYFLKNWPVFHEASLPQILGTGVGGGGVMRRGWVSGRCSNTCYKVAMEKMAFINMLEEKSGLF